MNKYMGFFELRALDIPAVDWREFTSDTYLDNNLLWTVRVAVENGFDMHLPRLIGVTSIEAVKGGVELLEKYSPGGIVIYYPYFIAEKSGVMEVSRDKTVIESIKGNLWELTTHGQDADLSVVSDSNGIRFTGKENLLNEKSLSELLDSAAKIRYHFRDEISEGRSILAEWSLAYDTDVCGKPTGEIYLVFYELRSL